MKHPNVDYVQSVLKSILLKRRFAGWKTESVTFAYFPSRYAIVFSNEKEKKDVSLITELFDEINQHDTPFTRRKVKKLIQKALVPSAQDDN